MIRRIKDGIGKIERVYLYEWMKKGSIGKWDFYFSGKELKKKKRA